MKTFVLWLADEAGSITTVEKSRMERSMTEISDLKRRIAAGEYKLDPSAIAEAMFSRADFALGRPRRSAVLEAREGDGAPPGVDEL